MSRTRRHRIQEDSGPGEGWLTTYGDLVTLLLVFFVVLYAMANTDLKNFEKIALSLRVAFNGLSAQHPSDSVIQNNGESNLNKPPDVSSAPIFFDSLPPKRRDFIRISTELTSYAKELGMEGEISVNMTLEGVIVSLSEELTFKPGETTLQPEVRQVLDKVVEILEPIDNRIRVEGHSDNIPTNSPRYPTNWELSVLRGVSVIHYLTEEGGMPADQFMAAGSAEFKPIAPNDTRANRALNRRVDIVILYPGDKRQYSISLPPS